jgi:hypothetical protein
MTFLVMKFSPIISSSYIPQHPVLKHPQSIFLLEWETKFHIHRKQQAKYDVVRFSLYVFR